MANTKFPLKSALLAALLAVSAPMATAHQATIDEHAQLVPIPAYAPPSGGANSTAAHAAMQELLATFNGAMQFVFRRPFGDETRENWSNLPARLVPREGLNVGDMTDEQRALLFAFLSAALGEEGYSHVSNVMAAEAYLQDRPRATFLKWAPENYFFTLYGNPSNDEAWGWQFGGHHMALNMSYDQGEQTSMTPTFLGAEPALFTYRDTSFVAGGVAAQKAGHALFASLDDAQKSRASILSLPSEVVTGPGVDGFTPPQIGLPASEMTAAQRANMRDLISLWIEVQPDGQAETAMAAIENDLDAHSFAWIGSGTPNEPAYFRIQGPDLVIELLSLVSNEGEDASGHYHSIIRVPSADYGEKPRN